MINQNTLFVLGAGAHIPYGFPSGKKLVVDLLKGFIDEHYSRKNFGLEKPLGVYFKEQQVLDSQSIRAFLSRLEQSGRFSIDKFLRDQENGFDNFGKRLIAFVISLYESKCDPLKGLVESEYDFSDSLYHYLYDKMDIQDDAKFQDNNVRFITFNYDRCLEHFFSSANQVNYTHENKESMDFLSESVIHVHGKIGELSDHLDLVRNQVPYGVVYDFENNVFNIKLGHYGLMGENIRIVSDSVVDDVQSQCLDFFKWSKKIIFLGFGYDRQNLMNIGFKDEYKDIFQEKILFGSTYGLTTREISVIKNFFKTRMGIKNLNFDEKSNMTSVNFLRNRTTL